MRFMLSCMDSSSSDSWLSFQRFHGKDHETPWLEWFVWSLCSALQNSWPGCGVVWLFIQIIQSWLFVVAFPRCLVSSLDSIARLGSCQCFATVGTLQWFHPVIQSQSGAYLYIFSDPPAICFPSKWASAYQRFDLWDWLCQGWSMNFSSLKYFQAVCLCHGTNS